MADPHTATHESAHISYRHVWIGHFAGCAARLHRRADQRDANSIPNPPFKIESYIEGRLVKSVMAPEDSAHQATIRRIVQRKNGQWRNSRVAHVPSVIFRSQDFKLTFHQGTIANDISEAEQPRQLECALSDDEFAEVQQAVGKIVEESAAPLPHK